MLTQRSPRPSPGVGSRALRVAAAVAALAATWGVAGAAAAFEHDIVVVLDNSGSMRRNDPDRLAIAAVQELIGRQADDVRVGLLVFDATPRLAVPLSSLDAASRARFTQSLTEVDYQGRWTNLPSALERGIYHLRMDGRDRARQSILFLTDGRVDTGNERRDRDLQSWLEEGLAQSANEADIRIYGIAFTEDADFRVIESVTRQSGGMYVRAFRPEDLPRAFERIESASARAEEPEAEPAAEPPSDAQGVTPDEPAEVAEPTPAPAPVEPVEPVEPAGGAGTMAALRPALPWILAAAIPLLALLAAVLLRAGGTRRRSGRGAVPEVPVPPAYLMDATRVTQRMRHDLGAVTVVGRKPDGRRGVVSVVIDRDTVSRRHAVIRYYDGSFWVADQRTRNGTFVNGSRLADETRLEPGDRLRFDKYEFVFDAEQWVDDDDEATRFAFASEDDEATKFSHDPPVNESPSWPGR